MLDARTRTVISASAKALKSMGATALYAFGSRNRGDHGPASDLDLFIDHVAGNAPSFFRLTALELELESELGFPVHITTRRALDERVKRNIEAEASQIF